MKNEKRVKIRKQEALIITVLFAIFALSVTVGCASAATYTVCPSGCDYTSIQAAINAADSGDTIVVQSGTYYEHVDVNKQLILKGVGTGSGKPVVDSGGNDSAITLSADGITFEGFTVTNSGNLRGDVGIKVTSNNNTITGNTASNNGYSIYLNDSCNNTITGNTASNNDYGIYLNDSCNNNITGNIASNNGYSIYLNDSCNNNITGNNASNNDVYGICIRYSRDNTISGNNASNNDVYGICIRYSRDNTISGNNARNNRDGIHLFCSGNNNITANTFVNDGLFVESSYQNTVEGNIVNGKPLVYLVDTSDIEVTDAGQVILVNCSNITVENLDLSNASIGVVFWDTEDSIIYNNNVSNNWYGIRLWDSSNNIIANNTASNNNYGISFRDSSNNSITGNNASNNNYGICFRDSNNNTISGNNVSNNGFYGIRLMDSSNNIISNNTFVNDGLDVRYSYQNTVEDNTVNGKPLVYLEEASGIGVTDAGQVILVNCTNITVENLDLSNTSVCVELWATEDSMISNNTVSNSFHGIRLSYSNSNIIRCNDASNNWYGIVLSDSRNNTISGNTACNSDEDGIYISDSSNNTISGNNASNNDNGICLFDSHNNTFSGNNASNNDNGICLVDSNNNTIRGNTANNNNWYGIRPLHSRHNKIYLNNFINNTDNVYSHESTNIWNSTEEMAYTYNGRNYTNYLGNYWSDYKEKYPEAEEINGCGIWDMPYSIDSDSDIYPLTEPRENYLKAQGEKIFDTDTPLNPYPSISGTHNGTITPSADINVSKLYTYPCPGTGGHTEYARIWNSTLNVTATWKGYHSDWHNISFIETFTLVKDELYNYTIRTSSYPQIIHNQNLTTEYGKICCTEFIDANGKVYHDWLPAFRLWAEKN